MKEIPLPEIALGFGGDGAPQAVHLDAQWLDLMNIFLDRARQLRGVQSAGWSGALQPLKPLDPVPGPKQDSLRVLVELGQRPSASRSVDRRRHCNGFNRPPSESTSSLSLSPARNRNPQACFPTPRFGIGKRRMKDSFSGAGWINLEPFRTEVILTTVLLMNKGDIYTVYVLLATWSTRLEFDRSYSLTNRSIFSLMIYIYII